jgi:hypothetical protein
MCALDIPKSAPKADTARTYRNRLTHYIRPSVDYPMFFSNIEPREGEELKNAKGERAIHVKRCHQDTRYSSSKLLA